MAAASELDRRETNLLHPAMRREMNMKVGRFEAAVDSSHLPHCNAFYTTRGNRPHLFKVR
jgi:hypothetical protein